MGLGMVVVVGLGLGWTRRRVWGGAKREAGLRSVAGAILVLEDQTLGVGLLSSSAEEGGGRSPYRPPNIFQNRTKPKLDSNSEEKIDSGY